MKDSSVVLHVIGESFGKSGERLTAGRSFAVGRRRRRVVIVLGGGR